MECTIYLAEDCNMICSYCYEGNEKNKSRLSKDTLKSAIRFIIDNNPVNDPIDLLFLGGEPLLNACMMFEAVALINSKYSEYRRLFRYSITTNGILLTPEIVDFFSENKFQVSVSIDGNEKTHNLNRKSKNGKNTFPVVIKNINYLIDKEVDFSVRMTITKNNAHMLYDNVKYFDDLGVKKIFAAYDEFADWDNQSIKVLDEQMEHLDTFYLNCTIQNEEKILNLYDYKISTFIVERPIVFCSAGSKGHVTINSGGEIYPCGFVTSNKEWKIGSVDTGIDSSVFRGEIKKHLVNNYNNCKECEIAFTCSGTRCGFKNFASTGYLNYPSEQICKLERILHNHNYKIVKELCRQKHPRFNKFYDYAISNNIKISTVLNKMFEELKEEKNVFANTGN